MGFLSDDLISNLEEMVSHLSKRCELFAQGKPYFSQTEVGATMDNILISIRRLEYLIKLISDKQKRTLLNVVDFKIIKVQQAFGHISSDLKLALKADVKKMDEEDVEANKWEKLIEIENESPIFTLRDKGDGYKNARCHLLSRVKGSYLDAQKRLEQIEELLEELKTLLGNIDNDEKLQREIYYIMLDDYRKNEWPLEFNEFIEQINKIVGKRKNKLELLKDQLVKLVTIYMDSSKVPAIKKLYGSVTNTKLMPFEIIRKKRKALTKEDISDYFNFLHKYRTLKDHIDSIPLLEKLGDQYKSLFVNKAAKAYMDLLRPAIWLYCEIQEKNHFPILLMVMKDLGLSIIDKDNKPFVQMKNYVNEMNTEDEGLRFEKGYSIFSKLFGYLGEEKPFCELEYGDISGTQFTVDKIKEYQEVYWRCFTILNQSGLRMPNEIKLASYLQKPHPNINLSVVMSDFTVEQQIRLNFLRSTLRRETLIFG